MANGDLLSNLLGFFARQPGYAYGVNPPGAAPPGSEAGPSLLGDIRQPTPDDLSFLPAGAVAAPEARAPEYGGLRPGDVQAVAPPVVTPPSETVTAPRAAPARGYRPAAGPMTPEAVPSDVLDALAMTESNNMHSAVGRAGERGAYQIMPSTAADYGVTDPTQLHDPAVGRGTAAKIMADYYNQTLDDKGVGDWQRAVAAYNMGVGGFQRAGGDVAKLPAGAQVYLDRFNDFRTRVLTSGAPAAPTAVTTAGVPLSPALTAPASAAAAAAPGPQAASAAGAPATSGGPMTIPITTGAGTAGPAAPDVVAKAQPSAVAAAPAAQPLLGDFVDRMFGAPSSAGLLGMAGGLLSNAYAPGGKALGLASALGAGLTAGQKAYTGVQAQNVENAVKLAQATGMRIDDAIKLIQLQRASGLQNMMASLLPEYFGVPVAAGAPPAGVPAGAPVPGQPPGAAALPQAGAPVPPPGQPGAVAPAPAGATAGGGAVPPATMAKIAQVLALASGDPGKMVQVVKDLLPTEVGRDTIVDPVDGSLRQKAPQVPNHVFNYRTNKYDELPLVGGQTAADLQAQQATRLRAAEETVNATLRQANETSRWYDPQTGVEKVGRYIDNPNTPQEFKDRHNQILGLGGYKGQPAAQPAQAPAAAPPGGSVQPPPETTSKYLEGLRGAAQQADANNVVLADIERHLPEAVVGPLSTGREYLGRLYTAIRPLVQSMGLVTEDQDAKLVQGTASQEQLRKLFFQFATKQARETAGSREAVQLVNQFVTNNPNLEMSRQGIQQMMDYLHGTNEFIKDKYEHGVKWVYGGYAPNAGPNYNTDRFEARWQRDVPAANYVLNAADEFARARMAPPAKTGP
jgi:transglycosylase-like protein with SLT domain